MTRCGPARGAISGCRRGSGYRTSCSVASRVLAHRASVTAPDATARSIVRSRPASASTSSHALRIPIPCSAPFSVRHIPRRHRGLDSRIAASSRDVHDVPLEQLRDQALRGAVADVGQAHRGYIVRMCDHPVRKERVQRVGSRLRRKRTRTRAVEALWTESRTGTVAR